jgi:hypothetical protein
MVRASKPNSRFVKSPEWLAFQTEDGSERRRLRQVPANWADLSDERLDLLLRVADLRSRNAKSRTQRPDRTPVVSISDVDAQRAAFVEALRSACAARRGVTDSMEPAARAYARAMREAGVTIGAALVDVKDLVRAHAGHDEPIFTPKVVGWVIAGFFAGTSPRTHGGQD